MDPGEIPIGLEEGDGADRDNEGLLGGAEADLVVGSFQGSYWDRSFGAGRFETLEGLGETLRGDRFHQIVDGLHIKRLNRIFGVGGDHNEFGWVGE